MLGLVGIFADITERKNAERVRDQLTERVALATKTGDVGIWEWALETDTLTWLRHMFTLYGLDESKSAPSYALWQSALHDDDRARAVREIEAALDGSKPFDSEFRIIWPNGEVRHIRGEATVLRNDRHEPVRMVGINWDISEVRSLADQIYADQSHMPFRPGLVWSIWLPAPPPTLRPVIRRRCSFPKAV